MRRAFDELDRYIGQHIRARRLSIDMTQKQLADEVGVTFQQVQKYEKGISRVSGSQLGHIAVALKVSPADFFPHHDGKGAAEPLLDRNKLLRALKTMSGKELATLIAKIYADRQRGAAPRKGR